jgi:hypothetical protein
MLIAPAGLNRVWFNPASSGSGDFVYSTALTGFQSPTSAGAKNNALYSYFAQSGDLSQWEVGAGLWNTSTTTLARTFIEFSSNSNAKVSFTNIPTVAIDCRGEDVSQLADLLHSFGGGC